MRIKNTIWSLILSFCILLISNGHLSADNKGLVLTGNLYRKLDSTYVLEIKNMQDYKNLDGKTLGFKIDDKVISILDSRDVTEKNNSSLIYNAIHKFLIPNSDGNTYTLMLGSSSVLQNQIDEYNDFEKLLNDKLKYKKENIVVEYYDNRVDGNPSSKVRVLYRIGGGESSSNNSSSSDFVTVITTEDNNRKKTTDNSEADKKKQQNRDMVLKSSDISSILNGLKSTKKVIVPLDNKMVLTKRFFNDLMFKRYADKEISFEKKSGNNILYKWDFVTEDINSCEPMDLSLSIINDEVDKLLKSKCDKYKIVSFRQKGEFPVISNISVAFDLSGMDVSNLKVYFVNMERKNIEKRNIDIDVNKNIISFRIGFGGDYIITDREVSS